SATASGKHATTYVGWVVPSAVAAAALALAALGGLATAARRRGVTVESVLAAVRALADGAASAVVASLVGVADALDELAAEFREAAADGWRGVLAWVVSLPGRLSLPDVRAWVGAAVAGARTATGREPTEPAAGADADTAPEKGRLAAVWQRFVGVVGVSQSSTKTPAEVAREAVRRGFPKRPVYAVTNAFRDAAYGGRPASSRLERARQALAALRDGDQSAEDGGDE
ncbi:MAG: DUF4129 domain-containing protein, partial [Halobacterium sp.]